ncbi:hypothetical protein M9458_003035, partial [Cirrhinus mrigala]
MRSKCPIHLTGFYGTYSGLSQLCTDKSAPLGASVTSKKNEFPSKKSEFIVLRSRLLYVLSKKRSRATSDAPHPGPPPAGTEGVVVVAEGDLGTPMEDNPPGTSSWTSHSPERPVPPVEFPGGFDCLPQGGLDFSFGAPEVDEVSIAASEGGLSLSDGEGSTGLPPSVFVAHSEAEGEMAAMLARAAESTGLEYVALPSPKRSWLDDWFLGSECANQPRFRPARAYTASGQTPSALHAMDILQVYQAKALKELDEGSSNPEVLRELRSATDYVLQATTVMAQALGRAMSTFSLGEIQPPEEPGPQGNQSHLPFEEVGQIRLLHQPAPVFSQT